MASGHHKKNNFEDIKSSINTGLHVGNVKIIPKRRGELFRRLKTPEMVTLLQLYSIHDEDDQESITNLIGDDNDEKNAQNEESKPYVFICHDAEEEQLSPIIKALESEYAAPFLLLDIREEEEFNKYHIKTSTLYDPAQLRRDRLGAAVYAFKNKKDKIIVICSNDQNDGIKFANDLCQKYIDNVFLLTTSIERFCLKFPDLCVGHSFPQKPKEEEPKAMMRYISWKPTKKHQKIKPSTHRMHDMDLVSNMSTATTRSWKP
jgi:centrosomal protein CEP41